MKVKIENHSDLARDIRSKAILNTNQNAHKRTLAYRAQKIKQKETINTLEIKVATIENLLNAILKKLNNLG